MLLRGTRQCSNLPRQIQKTSRCNRNNSAPTPGPSLARYHTNPCKRNFLLLHARKPRPGRLQERSGTKRRKCCCLDLRHSTHLEGHPRNRNTGDSKLVTATASRYTNRHMCNSRRCGCCTRRSSTPPARTGTTLAHPAQRCGSQRPMEHASRPKQTHNRSTQDSKPVRAEVCSSTSWSTRNPGCFRGTRSRGTLLARTGTTWGRSRSCHPRAADPGWVELLVS